MRPKYLQSAILPAQEYVCLSCRLYTARSLHPSNRRYQHTDKFPNNVKQDGIASKPSLADILRALISGERVQKLVEATTPLDEKSEESGISRTKQYTDNDSNASLSQPKLEEDVIVNGNTPPEAPAFRIVREKSALRRSPKSSDRKGSTAILRLNIPNAPTASPTAMNLSLEKVSNGTGRQDMGLQTLTSSLRVKGLETSVDDKSSTEHVRAPATASEESHLKSGKSSLQKNASKARQAPSDKTKNTTKKDENQVAHRTQPASIEKDRRTKLSTKIKSMTRTLRTNLDKARAQDKKIVSAVRRVVVNGVVDKSGPGKPAVKLRFTKTTPKEHVPNVSAPRTTGIKKDSPSDIQTVNAAKLKILPLAIEQPPVPVLAYGLERVLFNPGVYQLQDPRSRVYNFDPYLQKIMPVAEFDFNALKEYITSSRDESLQKIAKQHGKRYVGSTSSMTGILAHFHFLLSQWRPINLSMLSRSFPKDALCTFTELQRTPQAIFLRWKDGTYAIDADKQFDNSNILSMLGKSMEKLLTLKTEDFERYRRSSPGVVTEEESTSPESYHYSTMGDFLMRSQLDAHDARLPGTGMFDLKTRAVISVRMDVANYEHGTGYEIKSRQGEWESYEREYYDMIRAAFLKYSMQVRMGRMDGIFVAFHNVERVFGFQYTSLPEMDNTIHGQWDTSIGDQEFSLSLDLLNKILDKATKKFPNTSIRLHFETRDAATPFMYIFAEAVTEEQVAEVQNANRVKVEEFERNVLGRGPSQDNGLKWADIQANVEEAMERDELVLDENEESDDAGDSVDDVEVAHDGLELASSSGEGEEDVFEATADNQEDLEKEDEQYLAADNQSEDEEGNEEGNEVGKENDEDAVDDTEGDEYEALEDDVEDKVQDEEEDRRDQTLTSLREEPILVEEGNINDANHAIMDEPAREDVLSSDNAEKNESIPEPELFASTSAALQMPFLGDHITGLEAVDDTTRFNTKADQPFLDVLSSESPTESTNDDGPANEILAMTLTLRNKVNGQYVLRPTDMTAKDNWQIEYSLVEVPLQSRAKALYEACKTRRQKKLATETTAEGGQEAEINDYVKMLREMSANGKIWREAVDEKDRKSAGGVKVLGREPAGVVEENGGRLGK